MFLESIEIRNIRSIEEMRLDFSAGAIPQDGIRKWTILLGQNGTGKSTVLRAIGLILAGSDALPFLLGNPDDWIRNGTDEGSIKATLRTAEHERRDIEIHIKQGMGRSGFVEANRAGLDQLDSALAHTQRNYFTVGYGALRRLALYESNIARPGSEPLRAQSLKTLFDVDAALNPLQSWAMGLEYRDGDSGTQIIEEAMNDLLPDVQYQNIDRKKGDLIFRTPDGDVPLSRLSDGYQNVAAWIGDLLYRVTESFENYDDPLKTGGLLLIDEIDAHLHPKWQRQLRQFIHDKLPEFQIIGTTHSILMAHQLEEDECLILHRREDAAVVVREFPGAPADLRAHDLLAIGFDVETLDSTRLQRDKDSYRGLLRKSDKSPDEEDEQKRLEEQFGDLPDRDLTFGNDALIASQVEQNARIEKLLQQVESMAPVEATPASKDVKKKKNVKKKKSKAGRKRR